MQVRMGGRGGETSERGEQTNVRSARGAGKGTLYPFPILARFPRRFLLSARTFYPPPLWTPATQATLARTPVLYSWSKHWSYIASLWEPNLRWTGSIIQFMHLYSLIPLNFMQTVELWKCHLTKLISHHIILITIHFNFFNLKLIAFSTLNSNL